MTADELTQAYQIWAGHELGADAVDVLSAEFCAALITKLEREIATLRQPLTDDEILARADAIRAGRF